MKRQLGMLLVAGLLAGCGTTVPLAVQGTPADNGVGVGTLGSAAGSGDGLSAPGSSGSGSATGTSGGTTAVGGAAPTGSGGGQQSAAGGGSATGQGSTAPPAVPAGGSIEVGFIYTTGRQEAAAALGAVGVTSGDEEAQWKVLVNYLNAHGGIGGHQIKPIYYGESDTSSQTIASQEQAACTRFTQDNHVFAAMSSFEVTDTFLNCMQQHGVPTFMTLESISAGAEFQRLPWHFEPGNLNLDRQAAALATALHNQDYFAPATGGIKPKIGIFTYNTPSHDHAAHVLAAAVQRYGGTISGSDIQEAPFATQTSDTSAIATAASSAVLKFRSDGVNRVLFLDLNGLLAFLFMQQAASQDYRPRYGLTSQSSGSHLADLLGGNANSQLTDSVGIGWIPALDLPAAQYGDNVGTPTKKLCVHLMRSGGQSQGLSSPGAELVALGQCDDLFPLRLAASKVTGRLTGATLLTAINSLGNAYVPALTFSVHLDANHHDGVSTIRNVAYATSCSCFRYSSQPYAAG